MENIDKLEMIRKHLGAVTPGWIVDNCLNLLNAFELVLKEEQASNVDFDLIKEGYDILECPNCGKECKPDSKRKDGTIVYERHRCKNKRELMPTMHSFEINIDGELVE